jgi:Lon protease-like protein
MSARLPLFPLDLVLFPGELLPLHIFEPRYRRLLTDCLESDRRFGITQALEPGPGTLGTMALIRGAEPLADGRSNIVVLGQRRFGVRSLLEEGTPYLVAAVEAFEDLPETAPRPAERAELEQLAGQFRSSVATLADTAADPPAWEADPESFSFQAAALLESDPGLRVPLHAERRTRLRVRALLELLPPRIHAVTSRAEVHVRARSNGKGHHGHDIVTG